MSKPKIDKQAKRIMLERLKLEHRILDAAFAGDQEGLNRLVLVEASLTEQQEAYERDYPDVDWAEARLQVMQDIRTVRDKKERR